MSNTYISNITGLLDVDAIVKNLTLTKQKRLQRLAQDRALLQAKVSALNNFLSSIKDLQNQVNNLKIEDLFKGKKVNISDSTIITAQANENTPNISLMLKVERLSQREIRITSGGVNNLKENLSASTITLKYWISEDTFDEKTINFSGGTLQDLVRTINQSQNKVTASIYYDGSNYKLMLAEKDLEASIVETNTNPANGPIRFVIETTGLPAELGVLDFTLQEAKNAKILIGSDTGASVTSPTNTFKDLINGLNVTVQKPSTDFINLNISDSYDRASNGISELLNKINNVLSLLQELIGKGSLFQGNAPFTRIKVQFLNATKPLQSLGLININNEGKYFFNNDTFNSLLQRGQLEDIKRALEQTKEILQDTLAVIVNTFQNYIRVEDRQIQGLELRVETLQNSLRREEEKLRVTFSKIETLMYQNEKLRTRLENFVISLSENKK